MTALSGPGSLQTSPASTEEQSAAAAHAWTTAPERGTDGALRLMLWILRRLGWRVGHLLLYPIAGYFLLSAPRQRVHARAYLPTTRLFFFRGRLDHSLPRGLLSVHGLLLYVSGLALRFFRIRVGVGLFLRSSVPSGIVEVMTVLLIDELLGPSAVVTVISGRGRVGYGSLGLWRDHASARSHVDDIRSGAVVFRQAHG